MQPYTKLTPRQQIKETQVTDLNANSSINQISDMFTPPMIDGVTASQIFLPKIAPLPHTLYDYLCLQFPHIQATEWKTRFETGLIYNSTGQVLSLDASYLPNNHIFYYRFLAHEINVPFEHHILFENDHLLVVDKPHFLTISPTGQYVQQTLLVRLKKQTNNADLTPIHRLDRETAGIVLFSKQIASRGIYQQMFAERQVQKIYHAIAPYDSKQIFPQKVMLRMEKGHPFYTMKVTEGVPNSETDMAILEHNHHWAKYELKPITGKQHQLRVHLNSLDLAILHDPFYPTVQHKMDDDFTQPLQLLAKELSFTDPISQRNFNFISNFNLNLPD